MENENQQEYTNEKTENNCELYKSTIDYIANINNRANILFSQASFLSKGVFCGSLNNSLLEISRQYSKMNMLYNGLPDISKMAQTSSALLAARDANISISQLFGNKALIEMSKALQTHNSLPAIQGSLAKISNPLSSFLKYGSSAAQLISHSAVDKSLASLFAASFNIGRIAEYSLQAEKNFTSFNYTNLGSLIGIKNNLKPVISNTIISYSKSFSDFWKSYEATPKFFIELSPTIVRIPPIEYFNTSMLIEKISIEECESAEKELLANDLLIENEETLTALLPRLNPEFLKMWIGANQTLISNNVDRVRHFSSSLRELFTHVLHSLSPDDEVKKWTSNPKEHFQNNKPTRKARLLYIFREVNNDHFKLFIEADIEATLQFISLFQEGTHAVKSKLTNEQLISMKLKAESTLKYLLQTSYEKK